MDAVLTTRNVYSLADFSLSPFFRRQWSSIYETVQDCRPSRNKLMRLYIKQMPKQERPILGVDHTAWVRLHSDFRYMVKNLSSMTLRLGGKLLKPLKWRMSS